MATLTLTVPDIGGAEGAEVVEVLVAVGDTITLEQSLIVLESDKASMEIPATAEGKILALKVALGDALSEGDAIAEIETDGEVASATPAPQGTTPSANPASADEAQATDGSPMDGGTSDPAQTSSVPAAEVAVMTVEVPDIGTDGDVDLVELLVTTGQEVAEGDSLVLLESDKASMEVPAPAAGKITDVLVSAGGSVRRGTPLMTMAIFADGQSAAGSSPQASTAAGDAGTPSAAPRLKRNQLADQSQHRRLKAPGHRYPHRHPQRHPHRRPHRKWLTPLRLMMVQLSTRALQCANLPENLALICQR